MTDPTPTRAEVEALIEQLMLNAPSVPFNARPYDRIMQDAAMMLYALRERAESAEAAIKRQAGAAATLRTLTLSEVQHLKDMDRSEYNAARTLDGEREANAMLTEEIDRLTDALTAARRAEAAAWNDGCKKIADMLWLRGQASAAEAVDALRRAAPTEDR